MLDAMSKLAGTFLKRLAGLEFCQWYPFLIDASLWISQGSLVSI